MKNIKKPEILHAAVVHGLLEKVKTKDANAAKELYKIFVEHTREGKPIDSRLTDFVCNNLESLANGVKPTQAMHLINRRGKNIYDRRNYHIIERFLHLMDEQETDKPSHVQEQVGNEFFITGDQAIRIFLNKKHSNYRRALKTLKKSFQPILDICKKYKR